MHSSGTYTLERPTEHLCFGCCLAYPIVACSLIFPRLPLQGPHTNVAAHTEMLLSSLLWTIVYQNDSLQVSNLYLLKIPISLPSNTQLHMTQLQGLTIHIPPRTHHICTFARLTILFPHPTDPKPVVYLVRNVKNVLDAVKLRKESAFAKKMGQTQSSKLVMCVVRKTLCVTFRNAFRHFP